ncbi:MAG: GvpL/GvpF family gas vesicle protein [Thermodesulfobacteriota bacterium]
MKYLLYCIFEKQASAPTGAYPGVEGGSVYVIEKSGLAAAVSPIIHPEDLPNIPALVAYHGIIEFYFRSCTIIPLRFGTVFYEEADIERLLEKRSLHYRSLIKELDGCVEMSIKVIMEARESLSETRFRPFRLPASEGNDPGKAFLERRRTYYLAECGVTEEIEKVVRHYRSSLEGLYAKFKGETSRPKADADNGRTPILLSLYFLVPKESLVRFETVFDELKAREATKLLLSGPWPPFNFVLPNDLPIHDAGA